MSKIIAVNVPDIGNFKDIPVIEVMVKAGDTVSAEQSLITLETDKATMDVPAPVAGVVKELKIKVGDKVSEGSVILMLEAASASSPSPLAGEGAGSTAAPSPQPSPIKGEGAKPAAPQSAPVAAPRTFEKGDIHAEVVVLGAGPGGYTAAFRAADLGKQVVLIEKHASLGGVCLNVGCIPSKALLHVAKVISEADEVSHHGVTFSKPKIDIDKVPYKKVGGYPGQWSTYLDKREKRQLGDVVGVEAALAHLEPQVLAAALGHIRHLLLDHEVLGLDAQQRLQERRRCGARPAGGTK